MSNLPIEPNTLTKIVSNNVKLFEAAGVLFGVAAFFIQQENIYAKIAGSSMMIAPIIIVIEIIQKETRDKKTAPFADWFFWMLVVSMGSITVFGLSAVIGTTNPSIILEVEMRGIIVLVITMALIRGYRWFMDW